MASPPTGSQITLGNSALGNSLQQILLAGDIEPGSEPSYQLCKIIYTFHPLGAKLAESPITMAQVQRREISVPKGPEERLVEAFNEEWEKISADDTLHNLYKTCRIYGAASLALLVDGTPANRPVDFRGLAQADIAFNVFDPLNTSGSLVLNQNPNAMDFLKTDRNISVQGTSYHRSRTIVAFNERPIYLGYTNSAFGYVGRSVYQRTLFPLKSFIQSMITDDLIEVKVGVIVAKLKPAGSIVDRTMAMMTGIKRALIQIATTGNVLSISTDENIESMNLQNLDAPHAMARKNILENCAAGADMPAQLLNQETFAEGFGEGTEDAKHVAKYIDRVRIGMSPGYAFMDKIVQFRAWNPEFYKTIQRDFPDEYGKKGYTQAFYDWTNSFHATWPSLITEPDSEKIAVEETKYKTIVDILEALLPVLDPVNKALLVDWAQSNLNQNKMLFTDPLDLDITLIEEHLEDMQEQAKEARESGMQGEGGPEKEPKPRGFADDNLIRALRRASRAGSSVAMHQRGNGGDVARVAALLEGKARLIAAE